MNKIKARSSVKKNAFFLAFVLLQTSTFASTSAPSPDNNESSFATSNVDVRITEIDDANSSPLTVQDDLIYSPTSSTYTSLSEIRSYISPTSSTASHLSEQARHSSDQKSMKQIAAFTEQMIAAADLTRTNSLHTIKSDQSDDSDDTHLDIEDIVAGNMNARDQKAPTVVLDTHQPDRIAAIQRNPLHASTRSATKKSQGQSPQASETEQKRTCWDILFCR